MLLRRTLASALHLFCASPSYSKSFLANCPTRAFGMSAIFSNNADATQAQDICHIISPLIDCDNDMPTTLIILNTPITCPPSPLFYALWNKSQVHICADGGANRLYEADRTLLPSLIVGDLDSLRDSVRAYYSEQQQQTSSLPNVKIIRDPDQDCNDLDKALQRCSNQSRVIVYGAFGGRFDQEMASLQALFNWNGKFPRGMWLYNDQTCACLVGGSLPRRYLVQLKVPKQEQDDVNAGIPCEGPTCGLIPLGGPCNSATTEGFKWNLLGQKSVFGGLVSTSNHMLSDTVTIESSDPLVLTAEVHSGSKASMW